MLEIEDERTSKVGSYEMFIYHLKLTFEQVWLSIRFLSNVEKVNDPVIISAPVIVILLLKFDKVLKNYFN